VGQGPPPDPPYIRLPLSGITESWQGGVATLNFSGTYDPPVGTFVVEIEVLCVDCDGNLTRVSCTEHGLCEGGSFTGYSTMPVGYTYAIYAEMRTMQLINLEWQYGVWRSDSVFYPLFED
jgi:hypothetical protein